MKKLFFTTLSLVLTFAATAQGVKIGDTQGSPSGSAMLEIESTTKGLLPPRLTTAERDAIQNPANGLLIFNTTTQCYEGYNSSNEWLAFGCICPSTTANAGADQNVACASTTTLAGNTPISGTGTWSVVSGTAAITNPSSPTSGVTGLTVPGTAVLRWTIANDCASSYDDVTLTTTLCPFVCGTSTVTDADNNTYNTVLIGSQCWMKENLKTGTFVSVGTAQTNNGIIEKHCQNLSGVADATCPLGGLYQWDEAMNYQPFCNGSGAPPNDKCSNPVQGICPTGWHIPSHYEWTTLEKNVGSNASAFPYDTSTPGWLGTDEGGNLKATDLWNSPNTGATNSSGFTALPGGLSLGGSFSDAANAAYWWSSTGSGSNAWRRHVNSSTAQVRRFQTDKAYGFAIRCLRD